MLDVIRFVMSSSPLPNYYPHPHQFSGIIFLSQYLQGLRIKPTIKTFSDGFIKTRLPRPILKSGL